jgi:hypothetical protein
MPFHSSFSTGFKHPKKRAVQPLIILHFWAIVHSFIGFKPVSLMMPKETKAGPLKGKDVLVLLPTRSRTNAYKIGISGFISLCSA